MALDEYGLGGVKLPQANLRNRRTAALAAVPRIPRDDLFGSYNDAMESIAFQQNGVAFTLDGKFVTDPDADFFDLSNARQRDFATFETLDMGYLKPYLQRLETHPLKDTGNEQHFPPAAVLTNKLQAVDVWTPNTLWGGGYIQVYGTRQGTYPTIEPTLHPPLEGPRYSYAAVDSDALYAEAQRRVQASMKAIYGAEGDLK